MIRINSFLLLTRLSARETMQVYRPLRLDTSNNEPMRDKTFSINCPLRRLYSHLRDPLRQGRPLSELSPPSSTITLEADTDTTLVSSFILLRTLIVLSLAPKIPITLPPRPRLPHLFFGGSLNQTCPTHQNLCVILSIPLLSAQS